MSITVQVPERFARLLSTPTAKKLIAEMEKEADSDASGDRSTLAKQLKDLTAAHEKAIPPLSAALEAARERVKEARAVLAEREKEAAQAYRDRSNASIRYDRQRGILEGELRPSADPAIAAFIQKTYAETPRTGKMLAFWPVGPRMLDGSQKEASNHEAVSARIAALPEVRRQAEDLQLEALTSDEVQKRLAALWDSLPAVPGRPASGEGA